MTTIVRLNGSQDVFAKAMQLVASGLVTTKCIFLLFYHDVAVITPNNGNHQYFVYIATVVERENKKINNTDMK